jgi:hypothetical protein
MGRELEALVAGIRERLSGADTLPATLEGETVASQALDRLETLMAQADYEAVTQFRQLAGTLHRQFGASVREVETRLRSFDYERALAALRAMRSNQQG